MEVTDWEIAGVLAVTIEAGPVPEAFSPMTSKS
jgi:hypothetical protein